MVPAPSPRFRRPRRRFCRGTGRPPRRRFCRGTACRPPAFPLVTTRVGKPYPYGARIQRKANERTGNVDENKGRLSTADRQLEDLGHGAAVVLCSLNPRPRSQCPLSWQEPASLPIPSPPWGREWTAMALSSATVGRVRGWSRSTQPFCPSFLSCSSESWRASPFRRNCGAVNSSSHSRRGKNPSPVTLRLMTPPEPDTLSPRERAVPQSGRALPPPRLAQTCFPRSSAFASPPCAASSAA